jgi:sulfite exporter TauE/SafE
MDYALILAAGFFSSLHCVGMCGAIVIAYSTQYKSAPPVVTGIEMNNSGTAKLKAASLGTFPLHLVYNAGRVLSYTILGAGMGLIGGMLVSFKNASSYVSVFSGAMMVISGIIMLKIIPLPSNKLFDKLGKLVSKTFGKLIRAQSLKSKFSLGMMTPLFPCGILYAMLFKAGASENLLSGALTMLLFGVGMVPALVLTGTASSLMSARFRSIGDKVAAVAIILMGVTLLLRGFGVPFLSIFGGAMHHPQAPEASCCH